MTKLCIVCPPKLLKWSTIADAEFYQSEWVTEEQDHPLSYCGRLAIVDVQHVSSTGASDSNASITTLASAAMHVGATEVVVPDILQNSSRTLLIARDFLNAPPSPLQRLSKMFIPQGISIPDWIDCLRAAVNEFGHLFNTVGIPKVLEKHCSRKVLIDYIPLKYDIHMLGTWKGCKDFFRSHRVRSWDTSLPFAAAQQNSTLGLDGILYKPDLLMGDNHPNVSVLIENIRFIQSLIG